jgi:hypothetical protein
MAIKDMHRCSMELGDKEQAMVVGNSSFSLLWILWRMLQKLHP